MRQNRVLANSLPRGGPHLLFSAISVLGYPKYAGYHDFPKAFNYAEAKRVLAKSTPPSASTERIGISPFAPLYADLVSMQQWLEVVPLGHYIPAHIPWVPVLTPILADLDYRQFVIIRDPRALLLSLLFDTHVMPRFLIADFASRSPIEQLEFMMAGGEVFQAAVTLNGFADVYRSMLAWQNEPNCLLVRFEDLVGIRGGGSLEQQRDVIQKMASYLDLPLDDGVYERLGEIEDLSVSMFRIDQIEDWASVVGGEIVARVMAYCEPLCREAGYDV